MIEKVADTDATVLVRASQHRQRVGGPRASRPQHDPKQRRVCRRELRRVAAELIESELFGP